jgi:hypothetical protein
VTPLEEINNGGLGGAGSGGSGGPSFAIVFFGSKPSYDVATERLPSTGGEAGIGGETAVKAPDGFVGMSLTEFEVP